MKILVRLPNWLGDMVMSVGFIHQLPAYFPGVEISVIAKKGIHELLSLFPPVRHQFIFSKDEYKGMAGLIRFGNEIQQEETFDVFFCLPNSFSAAFCGFATYIPRRVGYKKELRQIVLTDSYPRPAGLHRVEEYIRLLELYAGGEALKPDISLHHSYSKSDHIVVNMNSEASSRRLTLSKAIELMQELRKGLDNKIFLIGTMKEKEFVEHVMNGMKDTSNIESLAGKTSLSQLAQLLASSQLLLTTDSGPAHLANALGTQTVVLFGAGNEKHTAPYNHDMGLVIRLGQLSCEPCENNSCHRFETPQCLERLSSREIIETVKTRISA